MRAIKFYWGEKVFEKKIKNLLERGRVY